MKFFVLYLFTPLFPFRTSIVICNCHTAFACQLLLTLFLQVLPLLPHRLIDNTRIQECCHLRFSFRNVTKGISLSLDKSQYFSSSNSQLPLPSLFFAFELRFMELIYVCNLPFKLGIL